MTDLDLRELERRTFRTVKDDGLWDVLIASVVALFAIAPLLSEALGDFWSSAVFLPIWLAIYLAIRVVRTRVIAPRVGRVRFGADRRQRLHRFGIAMVSANAIVFGLGVATAIGVQAGWIRLGGMGFQLAFGLVSLVGFSAAAYAMSIPRFYPYGLMLAIAPLIGEWLWRRDIAEHHGFPIVFGVAAAVMLAVGVTRFALLIRSRPLPSHPATL